MTVQAPLVTADEVFAVNKNIRWVALTTDHGDVLLNQMRPSITPYSSARVDEEFVRLGPLTLLGVAEKYSVFLKGVDYVVVWFGLVVCVYGRLGSQVLSVSIEKEEAALSQFLSWFARKRSQLN